MKLPRSLRHGLLAGALALQAFGASAAPACALAGTPGTRVNASGTPLELPAVLPDCDGVQVLEGAVKACIQDARGRLNCRSFSAVSTLAERNLASAGADTGLLAALMDLLKGKPTSAAGVTRAGATGLPFGTVLLVDGGLEVDFRRAALEGIDHVEIRDVVTNTQVAKVQRGNAKRIDAALFRAGRTYRWVLASPVPLLAPSGTFTVGDRALLGAAREQQKFVADTRADPAAQALMMAAWLNQNGLSYNATQALQRAGLAPE